MNKNNQVKSSIENKDLSNNNIHKLLSTDNQSTWNNFSVNDYNHRR